MLRAETIKAISTSVVSPVDPVRNTGTGMILAPDSSARAEDKNNETEGESKTDSGTSTDQQESTPSFCTKAGIWLSAFYAKNEFPILIVFAILLASVYPPLGAEYVAPQITAKWVAVVFIFFMSGLCLKTKEFADALQHIYFNAFIQVYNSGVVSACVFGFSRLLLSTNIVGKDIADGLTITACLPTTINTVVVLTRTTGGDEAAAIFNASFSNLIAIFLTPVLIRGYLGVTTGSIPLDSVILKLTVQVLLPVIVGQAIQRSLKTVADFATRHNRRLKKAQMWAIIYVIYTVFCKTFSEDFDSSVQEFVVVVVFELVLVSILMVVAWYILRRFFHDKPKLQIMGLFGATSKSVVMGVPFINTIYEGHPSVGVYTMPLLIWFLLELILGSFLSTGLSKFVEMEKERLALDAISSGGNKKTFCREETDLTGEFSGSEEYESSLPAADSDDPSSVTMSQIEEGHGPSGDVSA